jgi:hypothetical protein
MKRQPLSKEGFRIKRDGSSAISLFERTVRACSWVDISDLKFIALHPNAHAVSKGSRTVT